MDAVAINNLVKDHGPVSLFVIGMVLLGSLINRQQDQQQFTPSNAFPLPTQQWCSSSSSIEENETSSIVPLASQHHQTKIEMPLGLEETVLILSVVLPVIPLIINVASEHNVEMLKAHFAGQTSGYGLSQLLRHYIVYPAETKFLKNCNITSQECMFKTAALSLAFDENKNKDIENKFFFFFDNLLNLSSSYTVDKNAMQFCNRSSTPEAWQDLFDSIHHVPNSTCFLLGCSIVTLFGILFYWHRLNEQNTSPYNTSSTLQIGLICLQCVMLNALGLYSYYLFVSFDSIQIFGIILGAFLQFCIIVAMLRHV